MAHPVDNLRFKVDWERDQTYDHALSNITDYVLTAEWSLGFDVPWQPMNGPNQLILKLNNKGGEWNVNHTGALFASVLQRDVLVRVEYFYNSQTWYLAVFKIMDIQVVPGRFNDRTITLVCENWHSDFMSTIYDPPLTTNRTTAGAVLDAFNNGAAPFFPSASTWWIVGSSELDTNTKLPLYDGFLNILEGRNTLAYVGDNLDNGSGVSLYSFLEEMCIAEMGGRFRYQINTLTGQPYYMFYGRLSLAQQYNAAAAYTISTAYLDDAEYTYGTDQCNAVELTYNPRKVGAAGTIIATTDAPILIEGLGNTRITLRYRDPDSPEGTCTAIALINPAPTTDYTGNLASDGSGENYTNNLVVSAVNLTSAAEVTIANTALGAVYLTSLQLRGTPLTAQQPITLRAADGASIGQYGQIKVAGTIAGIDDAELVQAYADYFVKTHSTPIALFRSISFMFGEHTPSGLAEYVYEPLSDTRPLFVLDEWLEDAGDARPYWIAGMQCIIDAQERTWHVKFILEDYTLQDGFWKLDNTELGVLDETTRLAF